MYIIHAYVCIYIFLHNFISNSITKKPHVPQKLLKSLNYYKKYNYYVTNLYTTS